MNRIIFLALLVAGVALIIYGVSANDSIGGRFTRFFTGSPTDETVWMLLLGIVATIVGAGGLLKSSKTT
jgi:hypothetical protein